MRWFRWILRSHKTATPVGTCAYCGTELELCPSCRGMWRGRNCTCGLGLVCATHRRRWS